MKSTKEKKLANVTRTLNRIQLYVWVFQEMLQQIGFYFIFSVKIRRFILKKLNFATFKKRNVFHAICSIEVQGKEIISENCYPILTDFIPRFSLQCIAKIKQIDKKTKILNEAL